MRFLDRCFGFAFCLFGFFYLASLQTFSQTLKANYLGVEDGLSQSAVFSILQDRQGYMWFGTRDGLNRYDGYTFKVYRNEAQNPNSISGGNISALFEDEAGILWIGTSEGLVRFDRRTESFLRIKGITQILQIVQASHHGLWIRSLQGLFHYDPNQHKATKVLEEVSFLFTFPEGKVWALSYDIFELSRPDRPLKLMAKGNGRDVASLGFMDEAQKIWILTARFGRSQICAFERFPNQCTTTSLKTPYLNVAKTVQKTFWIGGESGLVSFNPKTQVMQPMPLEQILSLSPPSHEIKSSYVDRQGNIWLGTFNGVHLIRPNMMGIQFYNQVYQDRSLPSNAYTNGIRSDHEGFVWLATPRGLFRLDPRTNQIKPFLQRTSATQPLLNNVWQVFEDSAYRLWVGTKTNGLFRLDPKTGKFTPETALNDLYPPTTPIMGIRWLGEDSAGNLLIGHGAGLAIRNPQTGQYATYQHEDKNPNSLPQRFVNTVFEDASGYLWLGTDGGLSRLDRKKHLFKNYTDKNGLSGNVVWGITADPVLPHILWIATIGGGLSRLDTRTETFRCFGTKEGLPSSTIYGILPDHAGHLWLSTSKGIVRFRLSDFHAVTFDEQDGLQGPEFNLMAYHRAADGTLYFGGMRGINRFHPTVLTDAAVAPQATVSRFYVMGTDEARLGILQSGDHIRLANTENFFTLDLAVLDFMNPKKNQFQYQLEGVDEAWRMTDGNRPFAQYTNLSPGYYIFKLLGVNRDGVKAAQPFRLTIEIVPAWYQTPWVRWGLLFLVVAGVGFFYWHRDLERVRKKREEEAEQREMKRLLGESRERERLRIAQELHDGPMQQLYALGHQLDALQTPNTAEARANLNQIAAELRDVLSELRPSVIRHLGLKAALNGLIRRLERRYPDLSIEAAFEVDGKLWQEGVQHGLYRISQEALTNAIKHAQASQVWLSLKQTETQIVLEVRDNGRGFQVPERLVDLGRAEHYGLIGILERIEGLGGTMQVQSVLGQGTRISVTLPLAAIQNPPSGVSD